MEKEKGHFLTLYPFSLVYMFNDPSLLENSIRGMEADTREENNTLLSLRTPQAGHRTKELLQFCKVYKRLTHLLCL